MLDADNAENISSSSTKESCRTSMCCRMPPPPIWHLSLQTCLTIVRLTALPNKVSSQCFSQNSPQTKSVDVRFKCDIA